MSSLLCGSPTLNTYTLVWTLDFPINKSIGIFILASNVLCFKIFLLYSTALPDPAEFWIIIDAYPLSIIDNAFSTNIMPLPGAE